jgi:hypothetical protein
MAILMSKIEDRCDKLKSLSAKRAAAARHAHAFTFGHHIVLGRTALLPSWGPLKFSPGDDTCERIR